MINSAVKAYQELYERILPTGSRVICSDPSNAKDEDYLILVTQDNLQPLIKRLQKDGWITDMSYSNNDGVLELNTKHEFFDNGEMKTEKIFQSWKRFETPDTPVMDDFGLKETAAGSGILFNILVTCNEQYFDDFTRATFLATALDLKQKSDRVVLFEALTRDVWPSGKKKDKISIGYDIVYHPSQPSTEVNPGWVDLQSVLASQNAQTVAQINEVQLGINPPVMWGEIASSSWTGND